MRAHKEREKQRERKRERAREGYPIMLRKKFINARNVQSSRKQAPVWAPLNMLSIFFRGHKTRKREKREREANNDSANQSNLETLIIVQRSAIK